MYAIVFNLAFLLWVRKSTEAISLLGIILLFYMKLLSLKLVFNDVSIFSISVSGNKTSKGGLINFVG